MYHNLIMMMKRLSKKSEEKGQKRRRTLQDGLDEKEKEACEDFNQGASGYPQLRQQELLLQQQQDLVQQQRLLGLSGGAGAMGASYPLYQQQLGFGPDFNAAGMPRGQTLASLSGNSSLDQQHQQLALAVARQQQQDLALVRQRQMEQQAIIADILQRQRMLAMMGGGAVPSGNLLPGNLASNLGQNVQQWDSPSAVAATRSPLLGGGNEDMSNDYVLSNFSAAGLNPSNANVTSGAVAPGSLDMMRSRIKQQQQQQQQQPTNSAPKQFGMDQGENNSRLASTTVKKRRPNFDASKVPTYDMGPVKELSLPSDKGNLSEYQCLLRQQILLFPVRANDLQCSAQGRNKPIQLNQVGICCRYCAKIPPGMRPAGAVYFPAKLSGLYQASQNMAINHFSKTCQSIPEHVRAKLLKLKEQRSLVVGGGKHFWANAARVAGVVESEDSILKFSDSVGAEPKDK